MSEKSKTNGIVLDGEVYELIDPQIESCNDCDLDKFCDKFKEPLCNMIAGGDKGMIFKKQYSIDEHKWNISEAKDGDILSYRGGQWIFIFKKNKGNHKICYHALISDKGFAINDIAYTLLEDDILPATKEQCDLLFTKMQESGYIWDSEKKELISTLAKKYEELVVAVEHAKVDNAFCNETACHKFELGCKVINKTLGLKGTVVGTSYEQGWITVSCERSNPPVFPVLEPQYDYWDIDPDGELSQPEVTKKSDQDMTEFDSKLCSLLQNFRWKDFPTNGEIIDYVLEHRKELLSVARKQILNEVGDDNIFKQDYVVQILSDPAGVVYWNLIRKGVITHANMEEMKMVSQRLGEIKTIIDKFIEKGK